MAGPDEDYENIFNDNDPLIDISEVQNSVLEIAFWYKINLTEDEIETLENKTKRQHQYNVWNLERKKVITYRLPF